MQPLHSASGWEVVLVGVVGVWLATMRPWVLLPLLAIDALLIAQHGALHVLQDLGRIDGVPRRLDLTTDRSVSEILNWGKWLGIAGLLLIVWARTRLPVALGFAIAFAVIAADDVLSLHETQGTALARRLGFEDLAGLRAQDLGELLVWGLLGTVVAAAVALGLWAADMTGRRVGRVLLAFLAALVLFAVGFDMLHAGFMTVRGANLVLGVVEDGGEMIVGSLCLAFCASMLRVGGLPMGEPSRR